MLPVIPSFTVPAGSAEVWHAPELGLGESIAGVTKLLYEASVQVHKASKLSMSFRYKGVTFLNQRLLIF